MKVSHPHIIQYPIENDYIIVKFDYGMRGVKTELHQKVLLQVSVRRLRIGMLKKMLLVSMAYGENGRFRVIDSSL